MLLTLVAMLVGDEPLVQVIPAGTAVVSNALFVGVEEAWANSSFACDYELTWGSIGGTYYVDSEPLTNDELRRIHPNSIPFEDMNLSATPVEMYAAAIHRRPSRGVHFRRPDLQLIKDLPTTPSTLAADQTRPGGGVLSNPIIEHLSNTQMQIHYVHDGQRTSVGRAGLSKRKPDDICGFPMAMLTPISPFQTCTEFGQVNTQFGPSFLSLDDPRKESLIDLDKDHIQVERIWDRPVEQRMMRFYSTVVFNRSYPKPAIVSIDQKYCLIQDDKSDGELQSFDRVALLDHVDCGDGIFLAKRIVRARLVGGKHLQILLTEWKSSNLGDRPPRDEDFVIEVKGNDDTIGFADRTLRRLTPANLNPLGVMPPGTVIEAPPLPPKILVPRSRALSLLIWANLIGLPALALYLIRRQRRADRNGS